MGTWLPETCREFERELCVKLVIYKDYTEMHGQHFTSSECLNFYAKLKALKRSVNAKAGLLHSTLRYLIC